jgi:ferric-dicitrate binding protein FerR (iron transport regulator)
LVWRWLGVAASLAAVGVGLTVARRHANERQFAAQPSQMYTAARGQRSQVTLVDGTRVWLNVDSRLRVAQGYGAVGRDVDLAGEAYFVVQHDRRRPFRVHAGLGVLEDLGTEFDVRAYPSDTATMVTVASGRVSFAPAGIAAVGVASHIDKGQMGILDRSGVVSVSDHADIESARAWIEGTLRFSEQPLRDVVSELQRWYDIDISVDDRALLGVPVTASFTTQSADEALEIITATLGVHYARDGRYVRIQRQRGHVR